MAVVLHQMGSAPARALENDRNGESRTLRPLLFSEYFNLVDRWADGRVGRRFNTRIIHFSCWTMTAKRKRGSSRSRSRSRSQNGSRSRDRSSSTTNSKFSKDDTHRSTVNDNEGGRVKRTCRNPFLLGLSKEKTNAGVADNDTGQDDVLQLVLEFQRLTGRIRENSKDSDVRDDGDMGDLMRCAEKLLAFCSSKPTNDGPGKKNSVLVVSKENVAGLLLPWAVKKLLYAASGPNGIENALNDDWDCAPDTGTMTLCWRVTAVCLEMSADGTSQRDGFNKVIRSLVTQSSMHKLVPFAAIVCLSQTNDRLLDACALSYRVMAESMYRPTFEQLCESLVAQIGEYVANFQPQYKQKQKQQLQAQLSELAKTETGAKDVDQRHEQIVVSTLVLFQRILQSSNPKKTFQLLAKPVVLASIGKLYAVPSLSIHEHVHGVLSEGFFSPQHHMNGFRSSQMGIVDSNRTKHNQRILAKKAPAVTASGDANNEMVEKKQRQEKTSRLFRGYQDTLLDCLKAVVQTAIVHEKGEGVQDGASVTTETLPLIHVVMDGFIQESNRWEMKRGQQQQQQLLQNRTKRKNISTVPAMQFRFWSHLVWALLERLATETDISDAVGGTKTMKVRRSGLVSALLGALQRCVAIALANDVYLPSYEDKGKKHLGFLRTATNKLLSIVDTTRQPKTKVEEPMDARTSALESCDQSVFTGEDTTKVYETVVSLIRLNHLVVHGQLQGLFTTLLKQQRTEQQSAVSLLGTLVQTYRNLRQFDFFVAKILAFAASPGHTQQVESQGINPIAEMHGLLEQPALQAYILQAVEECPAGQVQAMMEKLDQWIGAVRDDSDCNDSDEEQPEAKRKTNKKDGPSLQGIALTTALYGLIASKVRVDQHTASQIGRLCEIALAWSVKGLLDRDDTRRDGLDLCGRLVQLHTRCQFWHTDTRRDDTVGATPVPSKDSIESTVSRSTENIVKSVTNVYLPLLKEACDNAEKGTVKFENELRLLGSLRLQQLHSLAHDEERKEESIFRTTSSIPQTASRVASFEEEARRLARFMASSLHRADQEASWTRLAEFLPVWVPYARTEDLQQFLRCFFQSLAGDETKSSIGYRVAKALLNDASFFELRPVVAGFVQIGIECAAALLGQRDDNEKIRAGSDSSPVQKANVVICCLVACDDAVVGYETENPTTESTEPTTNRLLVSAIQLDETIQKAALNGGGVDTAGMMAVLWGSVRLLITKLLRLVHVGVSSDAGNYIDSLIQDRIPIDKDVTDFDDGRCHATCQLLQVYARRLSDSLRLTKLTQSLAESAVHAVDQPGLSAFRMQMLHGLLGGAVSRPGFDFPSTALYTVLHNHHITNRVSIGLLSDSTDSDCTGIERMSRAFYLLLADVFWYGPETLDTSAAAHLETLLGSVGVLSKSRVGSFLLAAMVKRVSPSRRAAFLMDLLSVAEIDTDRQPVLAAAFIDGAKQLETDQLEELFRRMIELATNGDVGMVPKLLDTFVMILQVVELVPGSAADNGNETMEAPVFVRQTAETLFHLALRQLVPVSQHGHIPDAYMRQIQSALGLVEELTSHKEVLSIRERHLAFILASLNRMLAVPSSRGTVTPLDVTVTLVPPVPEPMLLMCCSSLLSLLQRFPHQICNCAPSLVLALQSLWRHVLWMPPPTTTTPSPSSSSTAATATTTTGKTYSLDTAFGRLTEKLVPHSAMLKKHVLGLLLDFVHSLSSGGKSGIGGGMARPTLSPDRKRALTPAVYSLLDVLSTYELKTLNSLLDGTGRAVFRPFYETYQRQHVYKGQY